MTPPSRARVGCILLLLWLVACDGGGSSQPIAVSNSTAPAIDPLIPQGATLDQPYTFTFAVTGFAPVTLSMTGMATPGLCFNVSGGVLAGTPTDTGSIQIVVSVVYGDMD